MSLMYIMITRSAKTMTKGLSTIF